MIWRIRLGSADITRLLDLLDNIACGRPRKTDRRTCEASIGTTIGGWHMIDIFTLGHTDNVNQ